MSRAGRSLHCRPGAQPPGACAGAAAQGRLAVRALTSRPGRSAQVCRPPPASRPPGGPAVELPAHQGLGHGVEGGRARRRGGRAWAGTTRVVDMRARLLIAHEHKRCDVAAVRPGPGVDNVAMKGVPHGEDHGEEVRAVDVDELEQGGRPRRGGGRETLAASAESRPCWGRRVFSGSKGGRAWEEARGSGGVGVLGCGVDGERGEEAGLEAGSREGEVRGVARELLRRAWRLQSEMRERESAQRGSHLSAPKEGRMGRLRGAGSHA